MSWCDIPQNYMRLTLRFKHFSMCGFVVGQDPVYSHLWRNLKPNSGNHF